MDFTITPEQTAFRRSVLEWASAVVAPEARDRDKAGRWDPEVWRSLAAQGLAGLPVPEEHGGAGASIVETCLANEAIGEGGHDGGLNLSLGAHWTIGTVPIWLHGTPEQQARYLPRLCSGEWIGSWASTEPEAGSDAGGIRTRAVRDGDEWIIDGTKMFITNGPIAQLCTVLAVTDPDAGPGRGVSAFLVETDNPGFAVGRELDKMGCRSSPTAEIVLTGCRVPADAMLGPEGEALWRIAFECFDWERTVMIAGSIGGMAATLDASVAYAKERRQFGKPIAHFQAVAHKLAEMKINLEVCRTAVYRAAWLKQAGLPHQVEASIAKTLVGDLSVRNALEAIQIHGGYGYMRDFSPERALRDAKLTSIGGGTTEIQKMIISRALLGE
ncbi:MAG TPA: acyl-CoA dehydrogenase family protein [Mycobacteriales bacterium]|jgi:alkylation response protein AidB-like acyl-CoA dehydrogenase|nr:acyl-CoA dehydrogenase family protein [Mycobacteriales bacterium]